MTESSCSRTSSVASSYFADDARRFGGVFWLNAVVSHLLMPAVRLMDHLRFSLKVALMGSIGALAIIVMLIFLVPMLNDSIRFVGLERDGARAILPLSELMDEMQRHRGTMARVLNGDATAVPVAEKIRQENKATIQALDDALSHEPFPVMEQWEAIRDPWLNFSEAAAGLPAAESFAQHTALVRQTLKLLSYVADESGLSLDPALDSYTLMDTVVNRLPAYWEEIGKLRGAGAGILASSDGNELRRVSLLAQRDIARYIYDRGDENFKSVIEHNPHLSSLQGLAQELEVRHQAFMKTFNEQFKEGHAPTISPGEYFAQGTATIGAALALTQAVVPALDGMLAEREAELRLHRGIVLSVCGLCALAAIYCFLGFSRSLSVTLRGLARASHQLADGEFPERIELHSKDELQDIADEIAKVTVTLRRFDSAQREVARKHDEGATDVRIDSSQFGGAFAEMAEALNEAFDGHVGVQQRMADVMAHYARGDMSVRMEELPGRRAELSNAINQVRDRLNNVNDEILKLADAAARGEFSVRGHAEGLEFRFADMVGGLNRLMQNAEQGLNGLDQLMTGLAAGDLGVRMEGEFQGMFAQLRDNAHRTVDQLADIVSRIHISAEAINSAAREIALGNNDLSSRTEQQAMLLQQTASSMDEATTTARQTTESAQHANQLAVGARDTAELGGRTVSEAVEMMRRIQESSHRIRDIVTLIDGIAFQTNILALNAAVEAARAGEQGRGFAVVANEVRSLAQRSAQGARDIAALVADSVQRVDGGTVLVERAGTQMNDIVSSVSRVADLMQDIASASGEQTQGIEQVNQAVIQMDGATQQNAAMVEEASASARSLESEADNLVRTVNVFQLSGRNGRRREGSAQERSAA